MGMGSDMFRFMGPSPTTFVESLMCTVTCFGPIASKTTFVGVLSLVPCCHGLVDLPGCSFRLTTV